jgi:hypothetical protein
MENYKLLLWINQSNGDTLGAVTLIRAILDQYQNVEIKFACFHDQAYLAEHLPIEVIPVQGNYKNLVMRTRPSYFFDKIKHITDEGYIQIHLWLGLYQYKYTWQNQVQAFNNQCKEKNINIVIDDSKFYFIELPRTNINVEKNAIFVENCQTVSGQTHFEFDMYKLSLMFPNVNFYTVGSVNFEAKNIFDCSNLSMIDLSNISRKCKLILGKGSGPFCSTFCEENLSKKKVMMGLLDGWRFRYWNESDENILLLDSEKDMIDLIRPINRGG